MAFAFAPLFNAQADEPEVVPVDTSATPGDQPTLLPQPLEQSPATAMMIGVKPYPNGVSVADVRAQL